MASTAGALAAPTDNVVFSLIPAGHGFDVASEITTSTAPDFSRMQDNQGGFGSVELSVAYGQPGVGSAAGLSRGSLAFGQDALD